MSVIPLDLQRRFEQRWAANFCCRLHRRPQKRRPERQSEQLAASSKGKDKLLGWVGELRPPQRCELVLRVALIAP